MLKKWWKYSSLRFYVLNAIHNYDFWLNSKKVYTKIEFPKSNSFRNNKYIKEERKRFLGYEYKGKIYLDNPGLIINDRDLWERWKKKKLI
jgi:hypothetical protein